MTDNSDIERSLRAHFDEHDAVSSTSVDLAKAVFDVVRADQSLAELTADSTTAARDDADDEVLRFSTVDVRVAIERGGSELAIVVSPPDSSVILVTPDGDRPIEIDSTGGATFEATGVVWLRVAAPGGTPLVTPPFLATP